jgi:ABC-type multidrug transport system fused ATPase/permease subunit
VHYATNRNSLIALDSQQEGKLLLKQALSSIKIILLTAKVPTSIKILQCVLAAVLTPLSIYFTENLIDSIGLYVNGTINVWFIALYMSMLLISLLFVAGNGFFDSLLSISIRRIVNKNLTSTIIDKFKKIDYSCFEDNNISDTINRMGVAPQEKILNVFLTTMNTIMLMITILGTSIIFVQASIWFSLAFIVILFPILWLDFRAMDTMNTLFNTQSEQERRLGYLSGLLNEKTSLFELKIFNAVDYVISKWKILNKKVLDERVKTTIRSQKYFAFSTLLLIIWACCVVFSLIWAIHNLAISIGAFVALIGSAGTILEFSEMLSRNFSLLSRQCLELKHYHTFLSLPEINEKGISNSITDPYIVFDNVYFTYPKTNKAILNGVSFEICPCQKIALVGKNGVGKSTIIKLLCKLYKPDRGKILINGISLDDIPSSQLKKIYSVVFQDYSNYSLTLRENIAFGDIEKLKDNKSILNAIKKGFATDVLNETPKGLDTNLGKLEDDGVDLSGGQWQHIAIARACLADSAFVILDEPTASLDPIAESEMYSTFASILKNKGCIMISHRLAIAKLADNIIVIHDGTVVEQGSHSELMLEKGLYQSMFTTQSAWYDIQRDEMVIDHEQKI